MREEFDRYLQSIEEIERFPPAVLSRYQECLVQRLVRFAHAEVPFYRERLACLFVGHGIVDLTRWTDVPILERAEVAENASVMRPDTVPEERGAVAEFRTSGTLATPLVVAVNGTVSTAANANMIRLLRWFGKERSRAMASIKIFPGDERALYPHGMIAKSWLIGHAASHHALHVATPVVQQLEWLARIKAPYLYTYPSNALALAEAVSAEQGRAMGIELVIGFAETIPDGTREVVAERFGATFASTYACQEIGTIAIECPETNHYHLAVENAVVELVDENGHAVPPGTRGRVVVTGLNNYAMPFIRYSLGDIAVAANSPCGCGCSLPIIERIDGRVRNAFVFRDGTRIWPRGWLVREMRAFVPFRQYQMVQLDHERIELRYVPDGTGRPPDLDGLAEYARRMMHPSVGISVVPMQILPRGPSGKFEDFISLVALPGAVTAVPSC